jgi:hypothetical protein
LSAVNDYESNSLESFRDTRINVKRKNDTEAKGLRNELRTCWIKSRWTNH